MRIAFQVNVISRFHGNVGVHRTRHFSLLPAKLTSINDEEDSEAFAACAKKAQRQALASAAAERDEAWTHAVEEVKWQILT